MRGCWDHKPPKGRAMSSTTDADIRLPGTPSPWVNRSMSVLLRLPGIRSVLGRVFGLITVTGWRSGRRYTTPIQHLAYGGDFIILSQRHRRWWRNLEHEPAVTLQVGRKTFQGTAGVVEGDEAGAIIGSLLGANPRLAKFYGIEVDPEGEIDPQALESLLEHMVVLRVCPDW